MLNLELRFPYADAVTAQAVMSAVAPENKGYVEARLEGNTVVYTMSSESAGTLRNTADDLMACIKVAEESAGLVSRPYIEPEEHE